MIARELRSIVVTCCAPSVAPWFLTSSCNSIFNLIFLLCFREFLYPNHRWRSFHPISVACVVITTPIGSSRRASSSDLPGGHEQPPFSLNLTASLPASAYYQGPKHFRFAESCHLTPSQLLLHTISQSGTPDPSPIYSQVQQTLCIRPFPRSGHPDCKRDKLSVRYKYPMPSTMDFVWSNRPILRQAATHSSELCTFGAFLQLHGQKNGSIWKMNLSGA